MWLLVTNMVYKSCLTSCRKTRLWIFRNQEISGKSLNFIELYPSAQPSFQNENFFNTSTKFVKKGNWILPVVRYFTWKLELVSNILSRIVSEKSFFATNLHQTPSNLICLTIFGTARPLMTFNLVKTFNLV